MKNKLYLLLENLESKKVLAPIVAILDSGADISHNDLASYIWTNPYEIANDSIDNDNNGLIDDIHGWNFIDNNNDVGDKYGHGTHVAGIVKNDNIKIMPIKMINDKGVGSIGAALKAIDYIVQMSETHSVIIVNNSWKSGYDYSGVMENRIKTLNDKNIMFVVSAGNNSNNNDIKPNYPASYKVPNVISVASINNDGSLTRSSNYGEHSVSVGAPGNLIKSTLPNNSYGYMSGTSMAAAYISNLLSNFTKDWNIEQAKSLLYSGAKKVKDLMYGIVGYDSKRVTDFIEISAPVTNTVNIQIVRYNTRLISGYAYDTNNLSAKVRVQIWVNDKLVSQKLASKISREAKKEIKSSRHGFVVTLKKIWLVRGSNVLKVKSIDSRGSVTMETNMVVNL